MSSFKLNSSMYGTQRLVQCAIDNQMSNGERTKMSQSCTINEPMSFEYALDTLKHYLNILSIGHIVSRIPSIAHCMFVNQRPTRSHHLLFRKNDRCHQMMDRFQCQTYTGDDRQTIPPNGHHRSYSIGRTRHDIFIPSTSSLQSQSILVFSIIGSILMLMQLVPVCSSVRVVSLNVPSRVRKGSDLELSCLFDLGNATLYSLKWFYRAHEWDRDEQEFFRYTPRLKPYKQVFPLEGIQVDPTRSGGGTVYIREANGKTTGKYKCEISIEGTFQTVAAEKLMTVFNSANGSNQFTLSGSILLKLACLLIILATII